MIFRKKQILRGIEFLLVLVVSTGCSWQKAVNNTENLEVNSPRAIGDFSLLLAGDAIITQKWSHFKEPEFVSMISAIRNADAAIINLEMLIHTFKGYAQAESGGTYMAARPVIAEEIAWAGVDMVAHANNHTFDYGSIAVLETIDFVEKAGIVISGSGKDLQTARQPKYFDTPKGKVALISTTSTFTDYGKASRSRPDIHGRPGLNPLKVKFQRAGRFAKFDKNDLKGNLDAVKTAATKAEYVVVTIHAHVQGKWLTNFARSVLDAGADVFFAHGPHVIKGIEIYDGKPIFYGLGDFVLQNEQVEKLPVEFYDHYGLSDDSTPEDAQNARSENGTKGFAIHREPWEGVMADVNFEEGIISEIRLIPIDLGFGKPLPIRGRPKLADQDLGQYIIEYTAKQAKKYGTEITYDKEDNVGYIEIK